MKNMGLNEIREKYLKFFETKEHLRMDSFSLIPKNDPSILLINAGMTPLKPYFTGALTPPAPRVTTCQKCIRTPDIERVGKTSRHGTYFEMLGNFSFGDYFKEDAIKWGWEFCREVLEMPYEKLSVSVYEEDDEAYDIWNKIIGLPPEKIFRLGKDDNFWEHGTGPCGPCSEIFFDRGEEKGCGSPDCAPGCDCDRFVEFWNLVFTQFNKEEDGSYTPLEKKNIDTGGGLERFACIMQSVDNLFEVDTVKSILEYVCKLTGKTYGQDTSTDVAIRVMTDHARSAVMMISDGILPDNASRGYVLRRLIRRASRFGRLLGREEPFLYKVADVVINESKGAYPELAENADRIKSVILREEESFAKTVKQGMGILTEYLEQIKAEKSSLLSGEMVFKLHDTFGFPLDLTREIAAENGCEIDEEGFVKAMQKQKTTAREIALKNRAGAAWAATDLPEEIKNLPATIFTGYEKYEDESEVLAIVKTGDDSNIVLKVVEGDEIILITQSTPFYAQSGGQATDTGIITSGDFTMKVEDVKKTAEGLFLHSGNVLSGSISAGDKVKLTIDKEKRFDTARNHTTTHLLHKALKQVLGDHVAQAGSDVSSKRLRFDFSHFSAMTPEEKMEVEKLVNAEILADDEVVTKVMSIEESKKDGATALFDEKYSDEVRVVSVGDYSKELCGGTHLKRSSQACLFKIVSESAIAAGVRRIEGVTGSGAFEMVSEEEKLLKSVAENLKSGINDLPERVLALTEKIKVLEKNLENKTNEIARAQAGNLLDEAIEKSGLKLIFKVVNSGSADELRTFSESVKDKIGQGVVVLASENDGKAIFVAMASNQAVDAGAHCGNIIREAAKVASGGGGGRPDMAQAGGKDASKIAQAIEKAKEICLQQLK